MEGHIEKLNKLCRVCSGKIKIGEGYRHAKFFSEYADIFTSANQEDPTVFPKYLCNGCKKKLDRVRKGESSKIGIELTTFSKHNDNSCEVCEAVRAGRSKQSELHVNVIDRAFEKIKFMKLPSISNNKTYFQTATRPDSIINVTMTITVAKNGTWILTVLNDIQISKENVLLKNLPTVLFDSNINDFCYQISQLVVCEGLKDFVDVINSRVDFRNPFPGYQGETAAFVESSKSQTKLLKENFDVIRSANCYYITDSEKVCESCVSYKKHLNVFKSRIADITPVSRTSEDSKTNFRYLQTEEMETRLRNLAKAKRIAIQKAARFSIKIDKLIKKEGVTFEEDKNILLSEIMKNNSTNFEDGTPQSLLWQQQLEQASKKNARSMRWHPLIVRWCLSIYHASPAAYRQMSSKRNKFLVLPHVNTLKKYLNFTNPSSGFNPDVIDCLMEDSDIDNLKEFEKNVSLLFDEIKIKSGLAYKRSTGQLVGFTEMGNINEEISLFQKNISEDETKDLNKREFAHYVNVFMVRGIFSSLCYPFGYYAGTGFTGDQLFPMVWEATHVLESLGFKVRAWVCDGASPNRKLFKINSVGIYFTKNIFDFSRNIYFISDVPHLLKTTRNNLENSYGNRKSRTLKYSGMDISWMHIISVYEWDLGTNFASPGLRRLHKLTEDHIRLSPRHRMKVKFAANVLSNSVACALEQQGHHDRRETINFVKLFDKAFDCLNVMRVKGGGKPERLPYKDINDPRFQFLESVLEYLDEWRKQVNRIEGLSQEERNKFCLSPQTDIGWHITIKSFIELAKLLLKEDGVNYLLSEKFSQDPLEEHFSRHRRSAGCNENPSLQQFEQQEVALNIIKSDLIGDLRGNTSGKFDVRPPIDITDTRLPRKKASKSKSN